MKTKKNEVKKTKIKPINIALPIITPIAALAIALPIALTAKQCGGGSVVTATHTVTFDDGHKDGSTITTSTVKDGERAIMHMPAHRDGNGFLGYKLVPQADTKEAKDAKYFDFKNNTITSDLKLYGWWKYEADVNDPKGKPYFLPVDTETVGVYIKWNPEAQRPDYKDFNLVVPSQIEVDGVMKDIVGIAPFGFYDYNNHLEIRTISLPDSIKVFSDHAFAYCSNLRIINFPKNLFSIHPYCFQYCAKLSDITLNEGLERIEEDAFNCLDNDVDQFLKNIKLPKSLKYIGARAFYYSAIETLDMSQCGNVEIGAEAFKMCYYLKNVILPEKLERIPAYCFAYCNSIRYLTIPKGVKSIGVEAFKTCSRIRQITIAEDSELLWIGDGAFTDCYSLEKINLPYKLKWFSGGAFAGCDTLNNVSFANCNRKWVFGLGTEYQEEWTPDKQDTYANAQKIKKFVDDRWMVEPEKLEDGTHNLLFVTNDKNQCYVVGLSNGTYSSSLKIPAKITTASGSYAVIGISSQSFSSGSGTDVKEVEFETDDGNNYLQYIGNEAFSGQTNIEKINLNVCKNLVEIEDSAFASCFNPTSEVDKITIDLSGCTNLTYIGDYAFASNEYTAKDDSPIQSIKLPASLVTLGSGCFQHLKNLESIVFSENCALSQIKYYLKETDSGWNWVTESIVKNTKVSQLDLSNCKQLKYIAEGTFQDDEELTTVKLPEGLLEIGPKAFSFWNKAYSKFTTVNIPSSCLVIGANAFKNTILNSATFDDATSEWNIYNVAEPYVVKNKTELENAKALSETYSDKSWVKIIK